MYFKRNFFIFTFLLVSFFLFQSWKKENFSKVKNFTSENNIHSLSSNINKNNNNEVIIKTDVFYMIIDKDNGNIKVVDLLKYKDKKNSLKNFQLLKTNSNFLYQIRSGLNIEDVNNKKIELHYDTKRNFFQLLPHHKTLIVSMTGTLKNGIKYTKFFLFKQGKYDIQVKYHIYNFNNKNINLNMFGEIAQTIDEPKTNINDYNNNSNNYRFSAYSSNYEKYEKYNFNLIRSNKNLYKKIDNGWIAMLQKYFVTAWVPSKNFHNNIIYTKNINSKIAIIGYHTPNILIPPYFKLFLNSSLWIGPDIQKDLKLLAPNLDLTVNYGVFWFLSQPLFKLLNFLHLIIRNWGFSIILITIIVRFLTYPLNRSQHISMSRLRSLQPKLEYLKNKYKNDKKKMSEKIIFLYQKKKINPLSGFLPLIIQMPIFLSLYYMLTNSIELRHSPFIFWIQDLSNYDQFYILPILMGITMFFTQKFSSNKLLNKKKIYNTSIHTLQEQLIFIIPIVFTIFFLWFPSGLVLYYIVNNIITMIQHKFFFNNLKT
ncbi:membrane protein insertase YidC [Buchnera aphidicola]|uniref:membrane protein insertase YidC n=1 Tax=Buchnera aphidicola TaxID=9 RepID=UPI0031B86026